MSFDETSIGGPHRPFPTTIWSDILEARDPASPRARENLERLLKTYWKPIYAYIRTSWRKSVEDAKDLTQAFLTHMLNKNYLSRLQPTGSFRGYLKRALEHFLIDAQRAEAVRRPVGTVMRLDAGDGDLQTLPVASDDETPESAYDRTWFRCLLDDALNELKTSMKRSGRGAYYEAFRLYCLDPELPRDAQRAESILSDEEPGAPTYSEVAERLGLQRSDVANYLVFCRAALRQILRRRIRDYVPGDGDVERELEELIRR